MHSVIECKIYFNSPKITSTINRVIFIAILKAIIPNTMLTMIII